MSTRELDAAGITDATLRRSYAACRALNAAHGKTFFLASLLLPAAKRPAVHALYAFARHADDIVDDSVDAIVDESPPKAGPADRIRRLDEWTELFRSGDTDGRLLPAMHDTCARYRIPVAHVEDFLAAMRTDLTVRRYRSWDDLLSYMHGSAGVIGLQMLPVLGTRLRPELAAPYAYDLGLAFQLVNFIRDVAEDLRRGRIYLPIEDLDRFEVSPAQLAAGVVDGRVRRLLAFQIARARELLRAARPGLRLLDPSSRDCVQTAWTLYGGILDAVERADYRVLDRRVAVTRRRRAVVAAPALVRAVRTRRG